MAVMRDMSRAQIAFQVSGGDLDQFQVMRYRGTEGLNQLYRFEIEMAAAADTVVFEDIVGKPAVLSINTFEGETWFHGIVSRLEMTGETVDQAYYRAELVPTFWLLTHRYTSRIFQNKNIKQIITDVLTEGGIPSDRFNLDGLPDSVFQPYEYCVQYRETDFNFISRLCEREGIWYFFQQSQDKHVLTFCAGPGFAVPITGDPALRYIPPTGLAVEQEHVFRFRRAQSVRPGAVVLNDFNFKKPKLDLEAKGDNARDPGLAFIDFPGEYAEQNDGMTVAERRAQEFESSRVTAIGQSNCKRLGPGKIFELKEHPTASFNGKYFITSVTHCGKQAVLRTSTAAGMRTGLLEGRVHQALIAARGHTDQTIRDLAEALLQIVTRFAAGDPTASRALTQWLYHAGQVSRDLPSTALALGGSPLDWLALPNIISDVARDSVVDADAPIYECRFECVPENVTWRPPRLTPWPVIRGCQTARVVGPEGEEIHVDKYGRVRVQFHWDRQGSENGQPKMHGADSSCWIRVCQGMAGGQYGIMFIPRVGQEVVVDFLEGNPDNPLIVGRVFNDDHMPPYPLPDEKTKSVIKTHSSKGGGGCNEIRFEDLKDNEQLLIQAQRRMDTKVKSSHFHTAAAYHLLVGGEKDGELYGEYRQKVFKAKQTHVVGEVRTWIEETEGHIVGKDQMNEIQGARSTSVGGDDITLVGKNMKYDVGTTAHIKGTDIKIEGSNSIELVSGGSSIVLCSGGIYIQGSMVYINSGAGPSVAAVEGGVGPPAVEDPGAAESTKPGRDVRYTAPGLVPPEAPALPEVPGHDFPEQPPPPARTSFIDIELLDDLQRPVPGERWEITDPEGRVHRGTTDSQGRAHLGGIVAGVCQIRFPRLDADAWERNTGA